MSLGTYFSKVIQPDLKELKAAEIIQKAAKWWLDLLRNLIVVAVIQYLAKRSESNVLHAVSLLSYFAMIAYTYSFFQGWALNFFHPIKDVLAQRILYATTSVSITTAVLIGISLSLTRAIEEIARLQAR